LVVTRVLLQAADELCRPRCGAGDEHELVAAVDEPRGVQADERVDCFDLVAERLGDLSDRPEVGRVGSISKQRTA
jgi:hypothetical protein